MTGRTIIRQLLPADVLAVDLQPCQALEAGAIDLAYGETVAAGGWAWTAERDGTIIGCGGLLELFPTQAVAWALLSSSIGSAMTAITRQARWAMANSRWPRVEALVRADFPEALEWATVMGMRQSAYVRCWGPTATDHVLFESIRA
ncbi:MAG: hypothetical protein ACOYLS_01295 [Polymorphobacter sp.]